MVAVGPVVLEEKSLEIVDGRTTDGRRTTEPAYTISCLGAFDSGELKMAILTVNKLLSNQVMPSDIVRIKIIRRRVWYITDELQWLEHLWEYENIFETGVVRVSEC